MNAITRSREAQRQRELVAAILAQHSGAAAQVLHDLAEAGSRAERGLTVYRANAEVLAERALAAAYDSVKAMIGDEDFAHLAADYWRAEPALHGDVGEWGGGFANWLEAHGHLQSWPYLADCARLDHARHGNERAADAEVQPETLALLSEADPETLCLELMPGCALIESAWPIVAIHQAHASGDDAAFETARLAIEAGQAQIAFVCRDGWRAAVYALDAPQSAWSRALLDGATLAQALDRAGALFDFGTWLADALARRWLRRVVLREDSLK